MKRILSLVLALVLVLGMIPMGFAADQTAGEILKDYKLISGYPDGSLGEANKFTRAEMMVILAQMNGKFTEAKAFALPSSFTDLAGAGWAVPYIAYAELNEWTVGIGGGKFGPSNNVTLQETAVFMLKALGYVADVDFNWTTAVEFATSKGILAGVTVPATSALVRGDLFKIMLTSLNTNLKDGSMTLGQKLGVMAPAAFAVKSVVAVNAKTVQITFAQPAKESTVVSGSDLLLNVTFTAIGTAAPITSVTAGAELSADGKVLTITPAGSEFFKGSYAVTVTNAVTDVAGNAAPAFSTVVNLTDSVRPTVAVSYPANAVAKFTFSEPINVTNAAAIEAAMTIAAPSGEASVVSAGRVTLAADKASFELSLNGFTIDKDYTVTMIGLADFSGNLIMPNPSISVVRNLTVDSVKPLVTAIEALDVGIVKITFSEKLMPTGMIINGEAIVLGTNASKDSTGLVYTVTTTSTASPALTGVTVVTLTGYTDLSGNIGASYSRVLNFVTDTTKPVYVSHEVKADGAQNYLYIKYSEKVDLHTATNALTGTYVDTNSITKIMTPILIADASAVLDGTSKTDTIKIKVTGLASGVYTVTTDANLVKDLASTPNVAAAKTITFTVGSFTDPTVPVPVVTSVQATTDVVVVDFNIAVTAATALNIANYTVEGQQVFESAIFDGVATKVKLTLKPNVITLSGTRLLTIQNVATSAGKVMASFSEPRTFIENVKPYLVSAKVASATIITATFNENVTGSASAFEVYKDGVKLTTITSPAASNTKTVDITVPEITSLAAVYTVKFVGTNFVDQAIPANKAVEGTIVTVTF